MKIENMNRYAPLAVGLMEIENLFRYTALAVGLKPSANQGKARLRGLWRIISSKTISPRLSRAKPACAGYTGLFLQRPLFQSSRGARFQRNVDRNLFRSSRREHHSRERSILSIRFNLCENCYKSALLHEPWG